MAKTQKRTSSNQTMGETEWNVQDLRYVKLDIEDLRPEKWTIREIFLYKIIDILSSNNKVFATFYSHEFNSSSCTRINNIKLISDKAQELYDKLENIPFVDIVKEEYQKI